MNMIADFTLDAAWAGLILTLIMLGGGGLISFVNLKAENKSMAKRLEHLETRSDGFSAALTEIKTMLARIEEAIKH